jgi:hypothetical protein
MLKGGLDALHVMVYAITVLFDCKKRKSNLGIGGFNLKVALWQACWHRPWMAVFCMALRYRV